MHQRFAERLAKVVQAKKKASGVEAAGRWWDARFGKLPKSYFMQVLAVLEKEKKP